MEYTQFAPGKTTYIGQQYGSYRIKARLGRGAFATVYLGEHERLGTEAAIKVMHSRLISAEGARFEAEARLIAQLAHPHVIRFMDYGFKLGIPFMVLEYAPYGSLDQFYPRGGALPLDLALRHARQIARGLDYIHECGWIHRDIKPQNLLIGNNHQILISDFGIAIAAHRFATAKEGRILGTPTYMAPEQINGHSCPASDQYALAVVMFELLSGSVPFQGTGPVVAGQQLRSNPPSLRELVPSISPAVEDVIMRGLAKRPDQRYDSCRQFVAALEQAASGQSSTMYVMPAREMVRPVSSAIAKTPATAQPHMSHGNKPARWADVAALLGIDLLGMVLISLICAVLHVETQIVYWLVSLWLTSFSFMGAFAIRHRRAVLLVGCIFSVALLPGLAWHSVPAFLAIAIVLLSFSALITFSLSLLRR